MGINYQEEREKRAKFGQKRLLAFKDEYDTLVNRLTLSNKMTNEMKRWLSQNVLDFEHEQRLLVERYTLQRIQYLKNPPSEIVISEEQIEK